MDHTILERTAGLNLKRLIKENGMTQEQVAFEFGVDLRTLNRYINEGIKKTYLISELAEYFCVDFMEFFKDIEVV